MNIEIANRLLELRKKAGLSQEELANRLGISRQSVSKWERAESSPDTDNLICLAKIYNVSLDEILNTDESIEEIAKSTKAKTDEKIQIIKGDKCMIINGKGTTYVPRFSQRQKRKISKMHKFPFPIFITILYLILGTLFNWWHPGWLLFLTIPLYYTLVEAIIKKSAAIFAYPVLVTIVFFILGFYYNWWHPGWVIFATIPLYYSLISFAKGKNNIDKEYQEAEEDSVEEEDDDEEEEEDEDEKDNME